MWKRARFMTLMLVASLPLALSCNSSMMTGWEAMRGSMSSARDENQAHLVAVRLVDTHAAVAAEMGRHGSAMSATMTDMDGATDDMQHCTGPGMHQMTQMRGEMTGEMAGHEIAMGQSATLTDAQAEAERHAVAMNQMLDVMDSAMGDMDCGSGMH